MREEMFEAAWEKLELCEMPPSEGMGITIRKASVRAALTAALAARGK